MFRGAVWSAVVLGVLATAGCQGNGETGGQVTETPPAEIGEQVTEAPPAETGETGAQTSGAPPAEIGVSVDRITFVNGIGELFTIGPDGDDLRALTGGIQAGIGSGGPVLAQPLDVANFYAWPTWSPDGTKIAASRVRSTESGAELSVEIIDAETARSRTVYTNETNSPIARGAPHYMYWSPDSRYLAFLAVVPGGQTLFVLDTSGEEEIATVAKGAPLYYHWSSQSDALLIHIESALVLARKPFDEGPQHLAIARGQFRAPAFSPDGKLFAYIDATEDGRSLFVTSVSGSDQGKDILEVGTVSAFAWSPTGQELAIADRLEPRSAIFEQLRVVSADGTQVRTIGEGLIMAYFWSPQGDKIAWAVLDIESRSFDWKVSPIDGGPARQIFRLRTSDHMFTMLTFFDQYGYSHSPWSPDGTSLVVSGTREETSAGRNGTTPTENQVFVLDATGAEEPRRIAPGVLAFWSWN